MPAYPGTFPSLGQQARAAQEYYHVYAPWGDTQAASIFGSSAALMGAEPYTFAQESMQGQPEPFPRDRIVDAAIGVSPNAAAQGKVPGTYKPPFWCRGIPSDSYWIFPQCDPGGRAGGSFIRNAAFLVIGAGLVLVGAYALTK